MSQHDAYKTISQFFNEQRGYTVANDLFLTHHENAADGCACAGVGRFADTVSGRSDLFVELCIGGLRADLEEKRIQLNAQEEALFRHLGLID
jgi:hypothetical protein